MGVLDPPKRSLAPWITSFYARGGTHWGAQAANRGQPIRILTTIFGSLALLGLICSIFGAVCEASEKHDFLTSLQNCQTERISRPKSAPERILEQKASLWGVILASFFEHISYLPKTINFTTVTQIYNIIDVPNLSFLCQIS